MEATRIMSVIRICKQVENVIRLVLPLFFATTCYTSMHLINTTTAHLTGRFFPYKLYKWYSMMINRFIVHRRGLPLNDDLVVYARCHCVTARLG